MRTLVISDDTADGLFRDILSSDYLNLVNDIKIMEDRVKDGEELAPYELEDLAHWAKTAYAISVLFDWYLLPEDAEKIRNQAI